MAASPPGVPGPPSTRLSHRFGLGSAHGHPIRQVLVALLASAVAVGFRVALKGVLVGEPLFLAYAAAAAATFYGTWRAGVLSAALCYVAGAYWFRIAIYQNWIDALSFGIGASIIIAVGQRAVTLLRQLGQANQRKSALLAQVAHEMLTPLTGMGLAIGALETGGDPQKQREVASLLARQIERLRTTVEELMDTARVEQGKIVLQRTRLDVERAVRHAVAEEQAFADSKGQELVVQASEERISVDADPHRLAQILGNLLHNSCKFSPEGACVTVKLRAYESRVCIHVLDQGPGIPPAQIAVIFDAFVQLPAAQRTRQGLGLGLALAKSLTEMHGGTIEVRNQSSGRGAEFVINLPRARATGALTPHSQFEAPSQFDPAAYASTQMGVQPVLSILVVEDNKDSAAALCELLEIAGHVVSVAGDGASALALAAQTAPDLVFLDLGLPDINGFAVARQLTRALAKPPVIVAISGWDSLADRSQSAAAGCAMHIAKPVTPQALQRALALVA